MLKKIAYTLLAFEGGGLALEGVMYPSPVPVNLRDMKVSIHVPTINEEDYLSETLTSIVNQPLYRKGGIRLVVLDSYSTDRTREIARRYTPEIWLTPPGKLSTRNYGFQKDNADIIVSADAGDTYPPGWLSRLLQPFEDPRVIATHGPTLSQDLIWKAPNNWFNLTRQWYSITARNSAIKRNAFLAMGGFNTNIDQLDRKALVAEEEVLLLSRLKEIGKVEYVPSAGMIKSERHMPYTTTNGRVQKYRQLIKSGVRF